MLKIPWVIAREDRFAGALLINLSSMVHHQTLDRKTASPGLRLPGILGPPVRNLGLASRCLVRVLPLPTSTAILLYCPFGVPEPLYSVLTLLMHRVTVLFFMPCKLNRNSIIDRAVACLCSRFACPCRLVPVLRCSLLVLPRVSFFVFFVLFVCPVCFCTLLLLSHFVSVYV